MTNARFGFMLAILISIGVAAWPSGTTQTTVVRGVSVAVTPGNLGEDTQLWDFAVAFHSRGAKLTDDIMDNAVLVAPGGRQAKPIWWEGEAAGGTHRAGVLKFIALQPRPKSVELRIQRPGEDKPRVFRFQFGQWVAMAS